MPVLKDEPKGRATRAIKNLYHLETDQFCVSLSFEQTSHAIVLARKPGHGILSSLECNCEIIYSSRVLWKRAAKCC
jgi:hypothetical protein